MCDECCWKTDKSINLNKWDEATTLANNDVKGRTVYQADTDPDLVKRNLRKEFFDKHPSPTTRNPLRAY